MRVIAGSKRSIPLHALAGDHTRPTTDRIKETLFNMLGTDVVGVDFLDLYAGSGQIGIEALSRGANSAVFCDNDHQAVSIIGKNLAKTGLNSRSSVMAFDVSTAIRKLGSQGHSFDIVFMDPPYALMQEKKVLQSLLAEGVLKEGALIVIEASIERDFKFAEDLGYEIVRVKQYKSNQHVFLKRTDPEQPAEQPTDDASAAKNN
ncbi:MAG: 16S rRNA (guanine(966)-N(2))-methyltransferase RsmD [Lachnospiraceae bacterium]|nr:16S rRNA (guanine(966)-N(2))-methyltransferase RsmD [Lachnospiraceae bacterium]